MPLIGRPWRAWTSVGLGRPNHRRRIKPGNHFDHAGCNGMSQRHWNLLAIWCLVCPSGVAPRVSVLQPSSTGNHTLGCPPSLCTSLRPLPTCYILGQSVPHPLPGDTATGFNLDSEGGNQKVDRLARGPRGQTQRNHEVPQDGPPVALDICADRPLRRRLLQGMRSRPPLPTLPPDAN